MKTRLQIILLGFFIISTPAFGQQKATKFHEMKIDDYICDNVKSILDNFAIALQNDPASKGYIILYGGEDTRTLTETGRGRSANQLLETLLA